MPRVKTTITFLIVLMTDWFYDPYPAPVPSAILLLGSGLAGLMGFRRMITKV